MRTMRVGNATATVINLGDLGFKLRDVEGVSESEWRASAYEDAFENTHPYPSQSVLLSLGDLNFLVDAGEYSLFTAEDSPYRIPGYSEPPPLVEQLSEIGVPPEAVNCVAITHAHYDHYAGVTTTTARGEYIPTFPNARYLLGREEYDNPEMQKSLEAEDSVENETFGVLSRRGVLELVGPKRKISDEIEVLASPGETPGHKVVRLCSNGETLYCVGDLFHHACEVENPSWMATWDDPKTNMQSRLELLGNALKENAILVPAHMAPGRVERTASGYKYVEI